MQRLSPVVGPRGHLSLLTGHHCHSDSPGEYLSGPIGLVLGQDGSDFLIVNDGDSLGFRAETTDAVFAHWDAEETEAAGPGGGPHV